MHISEAACVLPPVDARQEPALQHSTQASRPCMPHEACCRPCSPALQLARVLQKIMSRLPRRCSPSTTWQGWGGEGRRVCLGVAGFTNQPGARHRSRRA